MEGNCNLRSDPYSDFIMDLVYGYRKFKVLLSAIKVGIFDDVEGLGKGGWIKSSQVASYKGYDLDVTQRLLNTLAAMRLMDRGNTVYDTDEDRQYRNSTSVKRYLLKISGCCMVPLLHSEETLSPLFITNMPYVLRHGSVEQFPRLLWKGGYPMDDAFLKIPDFAVSARLEYYNAPWHCHSRLQPDIQPKPRGDNCLPAGSVHNTILCEQDPKGLMQIGRELFMDSWNAKQSQCLGELITAFNLRGFNTVCDMGGGTGRLAWHIIKAHPHIYMIVYDTPRVIESINPPFVMNQNLKFMKGDFFKDSIPRADCYILSHVLNEYDDEKVDLLLHRLYDHLTPGGSLLILEKVVQDDRRAPVTSILDDLLSATISRGRERTEEDFRRLLEPNGFRHVLVKRICGINTFDVLLAKKTCEPDKLAMSTFKQGYDPRTNTLKVR